MYEPLLFIHSWLRWIVLLAMCYFFVRSLYGWAKKHTWKPADSHFMWAFNQMFAYQVAFGIGIWMALSPFTKAAFKDTALILESPVIFFWTVRHGLTMILAIGFFQAAHAKTRRAPESVRFRNYAFVFGILLLIVASAIPWPGLPHGRNLLRWMF